MNLLTWMSFARALKKRRWNKAEKALWTPIFIFGFIMLTMSFAAILNSMMS